MSVNLFFPAKNDVRFYVRSDVLQEIDANDLWILLRKKVAILLNLLDYLEKEKYIKKVFNPSNSEYGQQPDGYVSVAPFDGGLNVELFNLKNATFIVLPKLEDLIKNNYKTEAEIKLEQDTQRAESTLRISRVALWVSIASVVISAVSIISIFFPVKVFLL